MGYCKGAAHTCWRVHLDEIWVFSPFESGAQGQRRLEMPRPLLPRVDREHSVVGRTYGNDLEQWASKCSLHTTSTSRNNWGRELDKSTDS